MARIKGPVRWFLTQGGYNKVVREAYQEGLKDRRVTSNDVLAVLEAHVQSARNKRCTCGWRPTWPDDRIGAEYYQHREHLAEVLVEMMDQKKP